jgi:hypothetical protein
MRVPKWLPLTLGLILPAIYFAVKWSRPEVPASSHPAAETTSVVEKEASPAPEKPTVIKKAFGSGDDLRNVLYRMSNDGNPLTCDIFNEKGGRVLKCRFGYSTKQGPTYGKVIEVQVFDAREATAAPGKKAVPLQRLIYTYDASGAPAKPITIALEPTGIAQRLLGTALVGFNPLTDWNSASAPAVPR